MTALQLADPFELDEVGPQRDRYDRPLLIPSHSPDGKRLPYTRASTLSNFITDSFGLTVWEKRLLALGLSQREDVCAMLAALPPLNDARCDKSTLTRAQKDQDADTKKKIDAYMEMALESAGRNFKANHGTAVHGFVEHGHVEAAPERMKDDVTACLEMFEQRGIEVICSEVFTANDTLMSAGSFDHLLRVPGLGIVVGDVKTGQVDGKDLAFSVQLSSYANGQVYDWHDDTRAPLESLTGGEAINRRVGLVVHIPLGAGKAHPIKVDLARGYGFARLATQVRGARGLKNLCAPLEA